MTPDLAGVNDCHLGGLRAPFVPIAPPLTPHPSHFRAWSDPGLQEGWETPALGVQAWGGGSWRRGTVLGHLNTSREPPSPPGPCREGIGSVLAQAGCYPQCPDPRAEVPGGVGPASRPSHPAPVLPVHQAGRESWFTHVPGQPSGDNGLEATPAWVSPRPQCQPPGPAPM